jgi:hypothetical protein
MTYAPFYPDFQAKSGKRLNKTQVASLPVIDPHLISIASLASRFIVEIEHAFTSIVNAPSNDGREVTVSQWFRGAKNSPELFEGERVEIDGAFNILIGHTFNRLINSVRDWHYKATRRKSPLGTLDIFDSKFNVDPPIEIVFAVQVLNLTDVKRQPLIDMMTLSQRHRYGLQAVH